MEENETARRRTLIEDALDAVLPKASERPAVLGEAMRWAVAEGLIQGMGGKLSPQATATRAQVATILMRFMKPCSLLR